MSTDEFLTIDGRPTVRVERIYPHPIAKVWRAVTTPEHLGTWFPSAVDIDLRPGGAMRFSAFEGTPAAAGEVEAVDAPRRLVFRWGSDRLTFDLAERDDGTAFVLTHTFDDRYGAPSFATGWETCLRGLQSVLVGTAPPPPTRGIARHEELVHEFGLDQPQIARDDDGWTVRIERQLTCPAEVAWDLWFGIDQVTGVQPVAPEFEHPHVLEFDVAPTGGPGEHVRLELNPGTGHGARAVLVVSGTDPAECDAAAQMWATGAIGHLAASAADWAANQEVTTSAS